MKIKFINNKFNYNKNLKIITGALFLSITLTGCQNNKVNEFGDLLINNPINWIYPQQKRRKLSANICLHFAQ